MKNAPITLIFGILLLSACQKEPVLIPTTPPIVEDAIATDRVADFEFLIETNQCLTDKVNISVTIENPQLYGFLWEINGNKAGHFLALEGCHCGTSAAITVSRLSDGVRIKRAITLPSCTANTSPIIPTKEIETELLIDDIPIKVVRQ